MEGGHLLKWKGRETGPFSEPQIREKLASREITGMHEVSTPEGWRTVRAFLRERDSVESSIPILSETPAVPAKPASPPSNPAPTIALTLAQIPPPSEPPGSPAPVTPRGVAPGPESPPTKPELKPELKPEPKRKIEPEDKPPKAPKKEQEKDVGKTLSEESEVALAASPPEQERAQQPEKENAPPPPPRPSPNPPDRDSGGPPRPTPAGSGVLIGAGFWPRLMAAALDLAFVVFLPLWILGLVLPIGIQPTQPIQSVRAILETGALGFVLLLLHGILVWIYFAGLESSSRRATPGKMLFDLVVTDENGHRVSFQRASLRFFGKFLSLLVIGAGFFLAAFTRKKQALHDAMSRCTVNFAVEPERIVR